MLSAMPDFAVVRKTSFLRGGAFVIGASFCAVLLTSTVQAQTPPTDQPPPIRSTIDANGVDLVTGSLSVYDTELSVGPQGTGGLARIVFGGGVLLAPATARDNLTGTINSSGNVYTVSLGAASYSYSLSGTVFTSLQGDGSTLTQTNSTTYTWVRRDGATGVFSTTLFGGLGVAANVARMTSLTYPNGEVDTYTYTTHTYSVVPGTLLVGSRIEAVTNNFGYEIKYLYQTSNNSLNDFVLRQVIALNNAVDYCAPTATACTGLTVSWPSVSVSSSNWNQVTDALGRQTTYFVPAPGTTQHLIRPSGLTLTVTYDSATRVTSFSNGVGTWHYSYTANGPTLTTTATDPNGNTRTVVSNTATALVASDEDGASHTINYSYDASGRMTGIQWPEGDTLTYVYDPRGNITTIVAKDKNQQFTMSNLAGFDTTCSAVAKCNEPNWTKDALGFETDYTYSPTTGQVLSVTRPAGANGLRPATTFSYASLYAWYKNSSGTIVQAALPVSLLTNTDRCDNAQTCLSTPHDVHRAFSYGLSGAANNLNMMFSARESGDGSLVASTAFIYDSVGNVLTKTDPLNHTTRYRYDVTRQLVGIVGPDPDGAGSLQNRASRITYECDSTVKSGCDGLVTEVEQGTVPSQADSDWPSFVSLVKSNATYDGVNRKTLETTMSGSTYINVHQFAYDAGNRRTCDAVRMNPAAIGSLPASACTLGTTGANGPDRIISYTYYADDSLATETSGYGTSAQAVVLTNTYGGDGELLTQKDAKGNLTTYVRDPFNYLSKIEYPTPGNGGVSSTTDYVQYGYDNNHNVTAFRTRDGTVIHNTYDALNQLTSTDLGMTYTYDNVGQLLTATTSTTSLSFTYNALGQQLTESGPLGTVGRGFYVDGTLKQLTYPDGYNVTYSYDATGGLSTIVDPSAVTLLSVTYDALGRVQNSTRAAGPTEGRSYGLDQRLSTLTYGFTDTSKNVTFSYAYNLSGGSTSATPSNSAYSWTSSRSATAYTSDGQNRYTTVGGTSFSYDSRGNLSSNGVTSYGYDELNRLTTAGTATLSYDALGRLTQTTGSATTQFLYNGAQIIAEYSSTGTLLRRYVPRPGLDQPVIWFEGTSTASSSARWFLPNAFGSIAAVGTSGSSTTTLGINTYDEYGVSSAANIGRFQYKGMPWLPEAGVYHARARAYFPSLGRFMQTDPKGYADGLNFYAFVRNNPINYSDPTGLCFVITDEQGNVITESEDCHRQTVSPPPPPPPAFMSFEPDFNGNLNRLNQLIGGWRVPTVTTASEPYNPLLCEKAGTNCAPTPPTVTCMDGSTPSKGNDPDVQDNIKNGAMGGAVTGAVLGVVVANILAPELMLPSEGIFGLDAMATSATAGGFYGAPIGGVAGYASGTATCPNQ